MAFVKYGTLSSNSAPVLKKFIIGNSIVVTPYCSVVLSSGFIALSTSSTYFPLGHVDAIETYRGIGEITTGVAGAAMVPSWELILLHPTTRPMLKFVH